MSECYALPVHSWIIFSYLTSFNDIYLNFFLQSTWFISFRLLFTPSFVLSFYLELSSDVHWVNDAIQPSHPLLSPSPPAFNLSQHQVFSNESVLPIRWPKYWSFSFSISPSNEYSGLISFKINWLDLLAVQGTLKSLLQHHSSKASILQHSAFFIVQLSHPYRIKYFLSV